MINLDIDIDIVQNPAVQALAWTLVHFLWQGAAIALASFMAFRIVRSASLRYAIGVGALVAMIAAPVTTLIVLSGRFASQAVVNAATDAMVASGSAVLIESFADRSAATAAGSLTIAPQALAIFVLAWFGGVAFFGIRLAGGWLVARRLTRRAVQPAADHIQATARRLAGRLAITRGVSILQSSALAVPVMVGWLKPAVILPVAALAGLSPSQMEALLAHELAHVRRQDYLINLLQSVAEAVLFYHPAVWWLSDRVRADRELCCDDLAVSVCDPLVYATALTDLAAMTSPGLALAATDGDLLGRVRRILGQAEVVPAMRASAMPLLSLVLAAGVAVPVVLASTQTPVVVRPVEARREVPVEVKPEPLAPVVRLERQVVVLPETLASVAPVEIAVSPVPLPQTAPPQTEQQRLDQQKREAERMRVIEIQRLLEQLEKRQSERVDQAVVAKEVHKAMTQQAAELSQKAREIQVAAAKAHLDKVKKQYEVGLVSEAQMNDALAALMRIQAAGDPRTLQNVEQQVALERLSRSRTLAEKGLISTQDLAAQEEKLKLLEKTLKARATSEAASAKALETMQVQRKVTEAATAKELQNLLVERKVVVADQTAAAEQLRKNAAEQLMRQVEVRSDRLREVPAEGQPVAANEPVKTGDSLRIIIEGEDMRMSYRVGDAGTIKMPFIGPIRVVGLTAAQVKDAIGKQLVAHKLKTVDQVTVTVTRPR